MRIVSLLPSATEIICGMGLAEHLVGISHECDYPTAIATLPAVTRTRIDHHAPSCDIDRQVRSELKDNQALYSLNTDLLAELKPDLIVTQSLCDVCAVDAAEVEAAASKLPNPPSVFNIQPASLNDVFETIRALGRVIGVEKAAGEYASELAGRVEKVRTRTRTLVTAEQRPKVIFLEWVDPLFNGGHWNPELVEIAGGDDLLGNPREASSTITWQAIAAAEPAVIFVACCGFTLERSQAELQILTKQPGWSSLPWVKHVRVYCADGNAYFNRPGPRLVDSLEMLAHALHPEIHSPAPAAPAAIRM